MIRDAHAYRDRAINALASLIGNDGKERYFAAIGRALVLPCGVVIAGSDQSGALDPYALKPFALKEGVSVIATWTDTMLSGHDFEIDVALNDDGHVVHHQALRLWVAEGRGAFLIAPDEAEPALSIGAAGIGRAAALSYRDKVERLLGITAGQALLQRLIFSGSPYATPLSRNIGR